MSVQACLVSTQYPTALTATGALLGVHGPEFHVKTRETGAEIRRLVEIIPKVRAATEVDSLPSKCCGSTRDISRNVQQLPMHASLRSV